VTPGYGAVVVGRRELEHLGRLAAQIGRAIHIDRLEREVRMETICPGIE
jgi:GAF domain-containing protein